MSADSPADAALYELTGAGLQRQREALAATAAELEHVDAATSDQIARARELVRASLRSLDETLREELKLLVALERVQRDRAVAAARAAAQDHGSGPGWQRGHQ